MVLALIFGFVSICVVSGVEWHYEGKSGVDNWPIMFPTCGFTRQSPIDINVTAAKYNHISLKPFSFVNYNRVVPGLKLKLHNNGHAFAALLQGPVNTIKIKRDGIVGEYEAYQFHFHWGSNNNQGSEHTLNGKAAPLEIHFIHRNVKYHNISVNLQHDDGLLVFGTMVYLTDGPDSIVFDLIKPHINDVLNAGDEKIIDSFRLDYLLPMATSHYMYYPGSLTTPGCFQVVAWHVFRYPLQITQKTLDMFRSMKSETNATHSSYISNNFRPVQPINGRIVQRSFDINENSSGTHLISTPIILVIALFSMLYHLYH